MGQSTRHRELCGALLEILRAGAGPDCTCASDAFVYWDASDPKRCLAPDGFVKLASPSHHFESWKTWLEGGPPELACEILSPSDSPERWTFEDKLRRYHALGVRELVVFFVDGAPGARLRVWDRIDEDFVERLVEGERSPCVTLGGFFVVAPVNDEPAGLRLAVDAEGQDLLPTEAEGRRAEAEGRRAEAEGRRAEAEGRRAAEERVRELERRLAATSPKPGP